MSEYQRHIDKHRHGFVYPERYCLNPWTFECSYHSEKYTFYVCASSDHRTWEEALEAAEYHIRWHTDEPLTDDLHLFDPVCEWPEDA